MTKSFNSTEEDVIRLVSSSEYRNVFEEETRIFKDKNSIKKIFLFISETMKDIKPENLEIRKKNIGEDNLVKNFLNLEDSEKLLKYKELYKFYNSIDNSEFNELLLYFFENQCQKYFDNILLQYNNTFSEDCCKNLLFL